MIKIQIENIVDDWSDSYEDYIIGKYDLGYLQIEYWKNGLCEVLIYTSDCCYTGSSRIMFLSKAFQLIKSEEGKKGFIKEFE